ncbi:MAG: DUF2207 domain-containing protein, partial [Coriobacteriia bacterium]
MDSELTVAPRRRAANSKLGILGEASLAVLLLAILLAVAFAAPAAAAAKSYTMGPVAIEAQVANDGSLAVVENRTFHFSGDYTFVYWDLREKGGDIKVDGLAEIMGGQPTPYRLTTELNARDVKAPGTYWVRKLGDTVSVYAFFSKADQPATFRLTYRVAGAAKRYSDVGELYWQFVGDQWAVSSKDVSVVVKPPTQLTKSQVRAWAHGPLTGRVTIGDEGAVALSVPLLPAKTFVEARILYPPSALAAAPEIAQSREPAVLAEETTLAEAANRARSQARLLVVGVIGGTWFFALAGLIFAIWAFLRYGREYHPAFDARYLREDPRPDLPPAVVGALWRFGEVTDVDIAASLMSLADRGVISVRPVNVPQASWFGPKEKPSLALTLNAERAGSQDPLDDASDRASDPVDDEGDATCEAPDPLGDETDATGEAPDSLDDEVDDDDESVNM